MASSPAANQPPMVDPPAESKTSFRAKTRGAAITASNFTSSSTEGETRATKEEVNLVMNDNINDGLAMNDNSNHNKAQRRVSFTTATTIADPPTAPPLPNGSSIMSMANSFPLPPPSSTGSGRRPSSRRSSLDSCSSFSSATSSCFSSHTTTTTAAATISRLSSALSFRDEAFQRRKLLDCLEWSSRHLPHCVVSQLMQQLLLVKKDDADDSILQVQPEDEGGKRRRSLSSSLRRSSSARKSFTSKQPEPRRNSLDAASATSVHDQRQRLPFHIQIRRSSFVHCETACTSSDELRTSNGGSSSTEEDMEEFDHDGRRRQRVLRTQESLDRLSSNNQGSGGDIFGEQNDDMLGYEATNSVSALCEEEEEEDGATRTHAPNPLPPSESYRTALLFVDISGFTTLSTTLPLEALSQTINSYFQCILECIQNYGGDVVKFAGDCVMVQWTDADTDCDVGREQINSVQIAAACACQIIERCSDFHVYVDKKQEGIAATTCASTGKDDMASVGKRGKVRTTLNVHCGIGYGNVIGFHTGDDSRREYLLLGDPIPQAADAIVLGQGGEVVASPEAYKQLISSTKTDLAEVVDHPQVIFSSRQDRFETNPSLLDPAGLLRPAPEHDQNQHGQSSLISRLRDWDVSSLSKLQQLVSLYLHPAVVEGEVFTNIYHSRTVQAALSFDSGSDVSSQQQQDHHHQNQQCLRHDQQLLQSEAEIRKVFTLFLQPLVSVEITGDPANDEEVMTTLNKIMVLANRELLRFKGLLRQFIVDDKGVVLIVNFGLRGSVFPQMIEEHAMPFATNIQALLMSELDVECRIGATYGNAYCGVVGGRERHEYSVLGPSVNLAARLMGHPNNEGFLVGEGVHEEARGWQFHERESVKAKGYADPVHIFEPVITHKRPTWACPSGGFVGREVELRTVFDFLEDCGASGLSCAKIVLATAESGCGKSAFLSETIDQVRQECVAKKHSHLVLGQVCCENDLFQPLIVLGPMLLDTLAKKGKDTGDNNAVELRRHSPVDPEMIGGETAAIVEQFNVACQDAGVPEERIDTLFSLVFQHEWPVANEKELVGDLALIPRCVSAIEQDEIARLVVSILLRSTVDFDLVLLGIDDISLMDELSWKVVQVWFEHACNLVVVGTSSPVSCVDINVEQGFWDYLFNEGILLNRFVHVELSSMSEGNIQSLVAHSNRDRSSSAARAFANEAYLQSGGNPRLAAGMAERFAIGIDCPLHNTASWEVTEHVLHRMDSVPAVVRTHLFLGALIGESFSTQNIIQVMEKYRGVQDAEKKEHSELVQGSLNEAVWYGILTMADSYIPDDNDLLTSPSTGDFDGANASYRFAHGLWRKQIMKLTLDSWQHEMQKLIDECIGGGDQSVFPNMAS